MVALAGARLKSLEFRKMVQASQVLLRDCVAARVGRGYVGCETAMESPALQRVGRTSTNCKYCKLWKFCDTNRQIAGTGIEERSGAEAAIRGKRAANPVQTRCRPAADPLPAGLAPGLHRASTGFGPEHGRINPFSFAPPGPSAVDLSCCERVRTSAPICWTVTFSRGVVRPEQETGFTRIFSGTEAAILRIRLDWDRRC
jgi:hypothetical protein